MNTQQNVQKILAKLFEETEFSGLDNYPVDINDLQNDLKLNDVETKLAIEQLVISGLISQKAIGNSMIQLTNKGKLSFKK